jgi:hypothetical protein
MADSSVPLNERVQRSFHRLSESAKALNKTSDQVSNSIGELDIALQKLNLGVSFWIPIHEEVKNGLIVTRSIGYDRVGSRWGIAIESVARKNSTVPPTETSRWLFNEAPRWLRVRGLETIPFLLDGLANEADKHRAVLDPKVKFVQDIVSSVKSGGGK